ncbi:MAG: helix-turn-helix transcriptional regulator [Prevotella sp.]|nr:helix-turn-helix transcriptional regulator [Prevotella sp.]
MDEQKYNRIKVVLAEKDKTGRWLAEQIGKSNCTVSKYVNQKVQPDIKTLNAIANALDVDVKDLWLQFRPVQVPKGGRGNSSTR